MIPAVMPTYARVDIAFERGEGAYLYTADGTRYLDFASGVAVTALGHAHPALVQALVEQAHKVWHTSNLFRVSGQERLAARLIRASFADTVFFGNSGAEAIELGIKIVRKYQYAMGRPERYRIITFDGAFHGRTLAALAATGNTKYLEGFGPPVSGFDQIPAGDLALVKAAITPETAGILIEPVQGEGGVRVIEPRFLQALRRLCDEQGLLLFFDEIQSGMGRTGKLFAHEWAGVTPDVMAVAKGIGGGFPLGACLATESAARGMIAGTHGSTYGGNPLAMAVSNAVLDVVLEDGFLPRVERVANHFRQQLAMLVERHGAVIDDVRGAGLLLGLHARVPNGDLVTALREKGLLAVGAGDNVVRLLPPLIIGEAEIAEAIVMIDAACTALAAGAVAAA